MITETATQAKIHFGQILEKSQREPILIEKSGRDYAVILSFEHYKRLAHFEDMYWSKMASEAVSEGFIGETESASLLESLVNAQD
ncbi:MAG: type II toxin-antitoxin system prevent-host-death family antitoxin [Myxococcaceae bacterium]